MNTWLSWELTEFGFPSLTGRARFLYSQGLTGEYLSVLSQAEEASLREHQVPIYETLVDMAAHDDAGGIRRLLTLCPWLDRAGYYDGITALGAAAQNNALNAMDALWEMGADNLLCPGLNLDELEFCWQYDLREETVRRIFRHGAAVEPDSVKNLLQNEEYALVRMALEESRPERICGGMGIQSLIDYIENSLSQEEPAGDEQAALEKGIQLLKELAKS